MTPADDEGALYTAGQSFRARAEARQRQYRSQVLKVGWERYGHCCVARPMAA
jgi:hypothetical protein